MVVLKPACDSTKMPKILRDDEKEIFDIVVKDWDGKEMWKVWILGPGKVPVRNQWLPESYLEFLHVPLL